MATVPDMPFDIGSAEFVAVYDELPLWSSLAGKLLLDHVPLRKDTRLLDVGCGTGFPLVELAQRLGPSCRAVGIDPWSAATARARQKARVLGIGNVIVVDGDAAAMPFDDDTFSLIVSNLGINNFEDPAAALRECWRVAEPSGIIALSSNLQGHMQEFYDVFQATLEEVGMNESVQRLNDHVEHRATKAGLGKLLAGAGFTVTRNYESLVTLRFLDGTALLKHAFIRVGFLDAWRGILNQRDAARVLRVLEDNLNERARRQGELKLSIPLAYIEARKPG